MFHPTSLEASLTFCPFLPIASRSCSSGTITSMVFSFSFTSTRMISAGWRALQTNFAGSSSQAMMSIRSPRSSWTTLWTRDPFMPTQAPTGSTSRSLERTAIFVRKPGSRATLRMETTPS